MRQGGVFGFLTLIAFGAIIGDVLTHPQGTKVGLEGLNGILKTNYTAALGRVPR